jgi:MoaA/NifB/PqqE/SkfB family radical SAM enzyme
LRKGLEEVITTRGKEEEILGVGEADYSQRPFIVIWEVTQACALACVHCRAEARPRRDARELTTEEGFGLIEQVKELSPPIFIFTGGDPRTQR